MLCVLRCLAGNGKRLSCFRYLTLISLVSYQIKSSALLAGSSPVNVGSSIGQQPTAALSLAWIPVTAQILTTRLCIAYCQH